MIRVRVYRNLSIDCWSIQEKTTKGWRVSRYRVLGFTLNDCKFIVHKGGQNRVRRENKKYVHAYVEGSPDCIAYGEKLEERIKFQFGYENCTWQSLFIQIDSSDNLAKIKAGLQTKEIQFRNDWFPPTHLSVPSKHGRESLGNTNQLASGALTLPIWLGMTQEQIHFISGVVKDSLHH